MNSSTLAAPVHLRTHKVKALDKHAARSIIHKFASNPALLTGSNGSATRAALQRLVQGLAEDQELEQSDICSPKKDKKRKSKDHDAEGEKSSKKKKKHKHD